MKYLEIAKTTLLANGLLIGLLANAQPTEQLDQFTLKQQGGIPTKTVLGYKIQGCHSVESYRNLCNDSDIQKVLNVANTMQKPNFAGDKKLVTLKYHSKRTEYDYRRDTTYNYASEIRDILVVDDNSKTIFVSPMFASNILKTTNNEPHKAPKIYSTVNSNWFCVIDSGAGFHYLFSDNYEGGGVYQGIATTAYNDPNYDSWACQGFVDGKFVAYDYGVPRKISSYDWLNKNGLKNEPFPDFQ